VSFRLSFSFPKSVCVVTVRLHSFQVLGYFITVLALCVSHLRVHLDLWSTPIYEVAWFDDGKNEHSSAPQLPYFDKSIHFTITPPLLQDQNDTAVIVENRQSRTEPDPELEPGREKSLPLNRNVWWDRIVPGGRAGRDHPFTIRRPGEQPTNHHYPNHRSSSLRRASLLSPASRNDWDGPSVAAATLPYYQPQYGRVLQQPPQPLPRLNEEEESFGVSPHQMIDPVPSAMVDAALNENEPIPVGDRSQWVRAAQAPGPHVLPRPKRARRTITHE